MCTENEVTSFYKDHAEIKWLKAIFSVNSNKKNIPTNAHPTRLYQIVVH